MNFDELKSRDIKELRKLAAQYGIKTGPRSKADSIAKKIFEFVANPPKVEATKHPAEQKAPEPTSINTEDQVREAVKLCLEKPTFIAEFPGDNTVIFRYRGAEESIHLSTVLRVIKSKAEGVARGATALRGLKDNPLNATSNSGIVMMV